MQYRIKNVLYLDIEMNINLELLYQHLKRTVAEGLLITTLGNELLRGGAITYLPALNNCCFSTGDRLS